MKGVYEGDGVTGLGGRFWKCGDSACLCSSVAQSAVGNEWGTSRSLRRGKSPIVVRFGVQKHTRKGTAVKLTRIFKYNVEGSHIYSHFRIRPGEPLKPLSSSIDSVPLHFYSRYVVHKTWRADACGCRLLGLSESEEPV